MKIVVQGCQIKSDNNFSCLTFHVVLYMLGMTLLSSDYFRLELINLQNEKKSCQEIFMKLYSANIVLSNDLRHAIFQE